MASNGCVNRVSTAIFLPTNVLIEENWQMQAIQSLKSFKLCVCFFSVKTSCKLGPILLATFWKIQLDACMIDCARVFIFSIFIVLMDSFLDVFDH